MIDLSRVLSILLGKLLSNKIDADEIMKVLG
jgi:hypothetical protein